MWQSYGYEVAREIVIYLVVTTGTQTVLKDCSIGKVENYWFRSMSPIAQAYLTVCNWKLLGTPSPDLAAQSGEDRTATPLRLVSFPGFLHFVFSSLLLFPFSGLEQFQLFPLTLVLYCFSWLYFGSLNSNCLFFPEFWGWFIDFPQYLCFSEFKWFINFLFKDLLSSWSCFKGLFLLFQLCWNIQYLLLIG